MEKKILVFARNAEERSMFVTSVRRKVSSTVFVETAFWEDALRAAEDAQFEVVILRITGDPNDLDLLSAIRTRQVGTQIIAICRRRFAGPAIEAGANYSHDLAEWLTLGNTVARCLECGPRKLEHLGRAELRKLPVKR